ncbi:MAG: T9SS type A sorting domain-containing protein [Saprospiraceae bacterium]
MRTISLLPRIFFSVLLFLAFSKTSTAQWTQSYSGTQVSGASGNAPMIWNVSVVDSNVVWASVFRNYGSAHSKDLFRTVNSGSSWERKIISIITPTEEVGNVFAMNADTAWASVWGLSDWSQNKSRVIKTTDGGNNWVEKPVPITGTVANTLVSVHFFNDSEGFAYGEGKDSSGWYIECSYTKDGGESWQPSSLPEAPGARVTLAVNWGNTNYTVVGDTVWFGASHSRIYRSIDKGVSWDTLHVPYYHPRGTGSVSFRDARNGIASTINSDSLGGIYALLEGFRTHDGGLTWERMPITDNSTLNRLFRMLGMTEIPGTGGVCMAYGYRQAGLVYQQLISYDEGETWNFLTGPYSRIRCMQFLSPTIGWAGGWRYPNLQNSPIYPTIFKWSGSVITDAEEPPVSEIQMYLSPNPATDYLHVTIDADPAETFQIQLIDLSGRVWQHMEIQGGTMTSISLQALNKGIFLIKVFNDKGTTVDRVIKF